MGDWKSRKTARNRRFEQFEDRLVLSADVGSSMQIGHFVEPVETEIRQEVIAESEGDLQLTLADAHESTGQDHVVEDYGFNGTGQTVVVIDSGIAWDHISLGNGFGSNYRVVGGYDFAEGNWNPYDDGPGGGHGTHVAGIIGADAGANSGVAPGVDLVGLRVFNDGGDGYFSWVESALDWVHEHRNDFENPITTVNLSLGAEWNSGNVPNWAMLEDEFAQLESDGIFISVAAGNSFQDYGTPGLAYPAASSHVVPVMSLDSDGDLSSYSQRHQRAIGAPGRGIFSTVPDYVGNFNGQTDDWASYSGTSMAAPYVAGASVIMRQAMEFAGMANISQDDIYDIMRDTADTVWDAATGANYKSLNLEAAINSIMGGDDFGSSAANAHDLGALFGSTEVNGTIGKLDDADFFEFTAAFSGTVTLTADTTHDLSSAWTVLGAAAEVDGDTVTFDVVGGESYKFGIESTDGLGHYTIDLALDVDIEATDWGAIETHAVENVSNSDSTWYRFEATRDNLLTVEAKFDHSEGNVDIALFNNKLQELASSTSGSDNERIDVEVEKGDVFYLRVSGNNSDLDLHAANVIREVGSTVKIFGTEGDDVFEITTDGDNHQVTVNGIEYSFDANQIDTLRPMGGHGNDTLTIHSTGGNDTAHFYKEKLDLRGAGYDVDGFNFETIIVHGGGGLDVARFHGTSGDEVFTGNANSATLAGDGFSNTSAGFTRNYAYSNGGNDQASFTGTAGDERFKATPRYALLTGDSVYLKTIWFDEVSADAGGGDNDVALLYDSKHSDTFTADPNSARMTGPGFDNEAVGFDRAHGYSRKNHDVATLTGSGGDDEFFGNHKVNWVDGDDFFIRAKYFDNVTVDAGAGVDTAEIQGTKSQEILKAYSTHSILVGDGYEQRISDFEQVVAHGNGGRDKAYLFDTGGDETYVTSPDRSWLTGDGFHNEVVDFYFAKGYSSGGEDRVEFHDSSGSDLYVGSEKSSKMVGSGYKIVARGFDDVVAVATSGNDRAKIYDTNDDDTLQLEASTAVLESEEDFYLDARGFDEVIARGVKGGNNEVDAQATDYVYSLQGDWD